MDKISRYFYLNVAFPLGFNKKFNIYYYKIVRFFGKIFICNFKGHNYGMISRPLIDQKTREMFLLTTCDSCGKIKRISTNSKSSPNQEYSFEVGV